jgi:hypothetical protein
VEETPAGVLIGVVDGLGHGQPAAHAAAIALKALQGQAHEPLEGLVKRCHEALFGTRGVVLGLVFVGLDRRLGWVGIGNIEAVLLRGNPRAHPRSEPLLNRRGVVGYKLPALATSTLVVFPGDTLVVATDGVRSAFLDTLVPKEPLQPLVDRVLSHYATGNDDALVLAARIRVAA